MRQVDSPTATVYRYRRFKMPTAINHLSLGKISLCLNIAICKMLKYLPAMPIHIVIKI